jgi:GNAT superfamily N-acetyltransferase
MQQIKYRFANPEDARLLASLNQRLIRDEGHRNAMDLRQLTGRMAEWLQGEYQAVLFEDGEDKIGYALFRREPEFIYLRQLFVVAERRRQGVAREALRWLWRNAWAAAPRLRIEVLVGNVAARAFWHSVGFQEYAITMEAHPPTAD